MCAYFVNVIDNPRLLAVPVLARIRNENENEKLLPITIAVS
jgi:hypothetical protein